MYPGTRVWKHPSLGACGKHSGFGFRVSGFGFRVLGSGFRGVGLKVEGLGVLRSYSNTPVGWPAELQRQTPWGGSSFGRLREAVV